jgi:hypothetical protein
MKLIGLIGAVAGGVVASVTMHNRLQKAKNRREENQRWFEKEMTKLRAERAGTKAAHKAEMAKMSDEHATKMSEMDAIHEAKMAQLHAEREAIEAEFASIRDQVLQSRTTEDLESAYVDFMLITKKHLNKKRD